MCYYLLSWVVTILTGHITNVSLQLPIVINNDRHAIKASSSGSKSAVKYTAKASKSDNDILEKPNSNIGEHVNGEEIDETVKNVVIEPKRAAKIHDFCFGIPYGKFHLVLINLNIFSELFLIKFRKDKKTK